MKKLIAILCLCLFIVTSPLLTGFSQGVGGCHAVVLIKRFDVTRFNNDPALAELTAQTLSQSIQEELGPVITVLTESASGQSQQSPDFEISGFYEGAPSSPSTLHIKLLKRKSGNTESAKRHSFSKPQEITGLLRNAGSQLAEEMFRQMDCKLGANTAPAQGQCFALTFSGTSKDTVHALQDPINGRMPGVGDNESRKVQQHEGRTVFVVSSEVVDPMKYAHLATPSLVNGANRAAEQMRQFMPGAAQMEQDLKQVQAPSDKLYQSIWGEGNYSGRLLEESGNLSMGDSNMGSSVRRNVSPTRGQGTSDVKGKLVNGTAYLELSGTASADVSATGFQKVSMNGQQSSVPWEPLLNQPGQKTSLHFSVPFKMPLRDGATTTVNYNPNIGMPGMGQGDFRNQFQVRMQKLPDVSDECKRAKTISDPDKAMRSMVDMMGPGGGRAFGDALGQMMQGSPGEFAPTVNQTMPMTPIAPSGSPQPQGYYQSAPSTYAPPAYHNQAYPQHAYPQSSYPSTDNAREANTGWSGSGAIDAINTIRGLFGF